MDWEFELNYQLQYAKEKKQERAKEKKEADKMQRAETEQCANGLDKFWVRIFFSFRNPHLRVTTYHSNTTGIGRNVQSECK